MFIALLLFRIIKRRPQNRRLRTKEQGSKEGPVESESGIRGDSFKADLPRALGVVDLHVTLIKAHKNRHLQFPF